MKMKKSKSIEELMRDPFIMCKAALKAHGVPDRIIDELKRGDKIINSWVHYVVMKQIPWQQVEVGINEALKIWNTRH